MGKIISKDINKIIFIICCLGVVMIISGLMIQIKILNDDYNELRISAYKLKEENDELWEIYDTMCTYNNTQDL
jgi:hypothetical protein